MLKINKKSIMMLSVILMASVAKASPLICVQDGYILSVSPNLCQEDCPGECISPELITRTVGDASCKIHIIEVDGKTYRIARRCSGHNNEALAEAVDELYPELPMKDTPSVVSVENTGLFICVQDGYWTFIKDEKGAFRNDFSFPLETCQSGCSGECIPEKIIREGNEDDFWSCEVHTFEFDGKIYRGEHSCHGPDIFIESMKERYPLLPIKYLNLSESNLE